MHFWIGCAVWAYRDWVGDFYPPGTPQREFLERYVERLTAVEGNTTFWATPSAEQVARWAEALPERFRFCPKMSRRVTHEGMLAEGRHLAEGFLERVAGFGDHLGPVLVQLPPSYGPSALQDLTTFLDWWPHERARLALEVRHRGWWMDGPAAALAELLGGAGAGRVLLDTRPIYRADDDAQVDSERKKTRRARGADADRRLHHDPFHRPPGRGADDAVSGAVGRPADRLARGGRRGLLFLALPHRGPLPGVRPPAPARARGARRPRPPAPLGRLAPAPRAARAVLSCWSRRDLFSYSGEVVRDTHAPFAWIQMFDDAPDFGELRSLLHGGDPSPEVWARLCARLERWERAPLEQTALPYLQSHLRRWPDWMRISPRAWLELRLAGAEVPTWPIVRAVACDGRVLDRKLCDQLTEDLLRPPISSLRARGVHIGGKEMRELSEAATIEQLRHMDWSMTPLEATEIKALAQSPRLGQLERLELSGCPLANEGITHLARVETLRSLHTLHLANTRIGLLGLARLSEAPFGRQLRQLDLSDNHLGRRGADMLSSAPALRGLTWLKLHHCGLDAGAVEALCQRAQLEELVELDLGHNHLRSEGLMTLAQAPLLQSVEVLRLGSNRIGDEGIEALIASAHSDRLRRIQLHWNPVTKRSRRLLEERGIDHDLTDADWGSPR